MAETSRVAGVLTDPYTASYGEPWERLAAIVFVGVVTGVTAGMATYVHRLPAFALPWATELVMLGVVFLSGLLVKLLVGEMRASVSAVLLSIFVGVATHFTAELAPFYILGIPTAGVVLYVPLRDVITVVVLFQAPLQFAGYLAATLYEGLIS